MTYYRASYLPASLQESVYNATAWPRNTLKSYAPRAREGYAHTSQRISYAPRVPSTLVRQEMAKPEVAAVAPAMSTLAAA